MKQSPLEQAFADVCERYRRTRTLAIYEWSADINGTLAILGKEIDLLWAKFYQAMDDYHFCNDCGSPQAKPRIWLCDECEIKATGEALPSGEE